MEQQEKNLKSMAVSVAAMEKPFDVKNLMERLKAKGLDAAEEVVKVVAGEAIDWSAESCALHPNAIVKIGAGIILAAKPAVMKELDKIDGQVG